MTLAVVGLAIDDSRCLGAVAAFGAQAGNANAATAPAPAQRQPLRLRLK